MHIPPDTYPERILSILQPLYHQSACIQERSIREARLDAVRTARDFVRDLYERSPESQRFQVRPNGYVTEDEKPTPVSNIRIFFD